MTRLRGNHGIHGALGCKSFREAVVRSTASRDCLPLARHGKRHRRGEMITASDELTTRRDARLDATALVRAVLADDAEAYAFVLGLSDDPVRMRALVRCAVAGWAVALAELFGPGPLSALTTMQASLSEAGQRADR